MATKPTEPGKDDVHEQRHPNQQAEGVVNGGSAEAGGVQAPKPPPATPRPATEKT